MKELTKKCLEKAYQLSCDVYHETIIQYESELMEKGEVLPEEIIFHKEDLIKLIEYCLTNKK